MSLLGKWLQKSSKLIGKKAKNQHPRLFGATLPAQPLSLPPLSAPAT